MRIRFVEASNGFNWGKFIVAELEAEDWRYPGVHPPMAQRLVASQGWDRTHAWVLDLATGEGAFFKLGGYAEADLDKHRIWVCLLFEPFLAWLYGHYREAPEDWFDKLPPAVDLPGTPRGLYGYRRRGPQPPPAHPRIRAWLRRSTAGRRRLPPQRWYRARRANRRT